MQTASAALECALAPLSPDPACSRTLCLTQRQHHLESMSSCKDGLLEQTTALQRNECNDMRLDRPL